MIEIKYRPLGSTGINVTAMGIGTQAWGTKSFGYGSKYNEEDLFAAFKASLDAGINFFDTADNYAAGESERLLGKFIKEDGRPVIIGSKFSKAKWFDPSPYKSAQDVNKAIDNTLKNLGLQKLDLYQLHYPEKGDKIIGYLDALADTVKDGKVKAIGVCNFSAELLRFACKYLEKKGVPIVSNQFGYNLLHRPPEKNGLIVTCDEFNVTPIAILPLAEGILTGKYRVNGLDYPRSVKSIMKVIQMDMFGTGHSQFWLKSLFETPYELRKEKLEPLFQLMEEIAVEHQATIPQVALNWLLNSHPKMVYIPGAKNLKQASDNLASLKWEMTSNEFNQLNELESQLWHAYKK